MKSLFLHQLRILGTFAGAALALGCSAHDETGTGTLDISVWGEEYIESGIPETEFADGWSVVFSKFLIVIGDVIVGDDQDGEGARVSGSRLFDLVANGPHRVATLENVKARAWDNVGYAIVPADGDTQVQSSASNDDLETMLAGPYNLYVAGDARKGADSRRFDWAFAEPTSYERCVAIEQGRRSAGIVVRPGAREDMELTIHGDHFFYDDLAAEEAVLRFDAMALADADEDGEITLDELSRVKLVDIPEGTYGTGNASDVNDLRAFVRALTRTLGHFRGEGHCFAKD